MFSTCEKCTISHDQVTSERWIRFDDLCYFSPCAWSVVCTLLMTNTERKEKDIEIACSRRLIYIIVHLLLIYTVPSIVADDANDLVVRRIIGQCISSAVPSLATRFIGFVTNDTQCFARAPGETVFCQRRMVLRVTVKI